MRRRSVLVSRVTSCE